MPLLDVSHDFAHPVEGDAAWSESYYFNGYHPASDTGFFTRIGIRPNEGTMDVGMSVWLPDGKLAEYRARRDQHEMVDAELAVGGVGYSMVEPMRRWRIRMSGTATVRACGAPGEVAAAPPGTVDLELDATFSALTPPIGTDGQHHGSRSSGAASAAAETVGKGHFEQAGAWSGHLQINGTTCHWEGARGNRDRSWGPRRWGGPPMWRWFSVNIGDDTHFGGIRLGTAAGDLHRGWVWTSGRATSIAEWGIRTELADDGLTQQVVWVSARDKSGRLHELRGDVLRVASIGRPGHGAASTVVNEGLARWSYRGEIGYGIAEYLHQLDPHGRPVVAVE